MLIRLYIMNRPGIRPNNQSSIGRPMPLNILIIRPSAIGDIVMASPMIRGLKTAWPESRVTWLADPMAKDLLAHHPLLDDVITWSKAETVSMFRKGHYGRLLIRLSALRRQLQSCRFDLVLDAQGLLRSRLLAKFSGASKTIGFESKEPGQFLLTRTISRGSNSRKMGSEYRHMLSMLGIAPQQFQPEIFLAEADEISARNKLIDAAINAPYAVLCPFTTRAQKHWFEDRWAAVSNILSNRLELCPLILGGPADVLAARRIQSLVSDKLNDFTGKTTVGEAAALIKHAALVIGVDTGLVHMGTAFARPTIAIFGATCPYVQTESRQTIVLYEPMACSPCRRQPTCKGRYDCMRAHTVEHVALAAERLLSKASPPPPFIPCPADIQPAT